MKKTFRLQLIRHAPPVTGGRLAGRTDVDADCGESSGFAEMRRMIGMPGQVISSPARRCLQTAAALGFPTPATNPALWEQDYGDWEGRRYEDLPDLGRLTPQELAVHRPDGGEGFDDMTARVLPELRGLQGDTLIIAHAGTVRAALSLVIGAAALSFSISPLSLTVMRYSGEWSVEAVNLTAKKRSR